MSLAHQHADHVAYLDGWRGVAIALLLVGHFMPVPGINLGAVGVNFFFVLSGLLMARLLFVRRTPIGVFYRRRISRIVPALLVFLAVITTCQLAQGLPVSLREVAAAALFLNNYIAPAAGPGTALMPFGHIWSLSVEEHAYVLLSLIAAGARSRRWSARTGLSVLCVLTALATLFYGIWNPPNLAFSHWLHTETAAYGVLLSCAILVTLGRRQIPSHWGASVPLLVLAGVALHWWSVPLEWQRLAGVGCFAIAVNLLAVAPRWLLRALSWAPLRRLGECSFSLYLWQQPFVNPVHEGQVSILVGLAGAIGCGLLSYHLIEMPVRAYLNRTWGCMPTRQGHGASSREHPMTVELGQR